jgi:hypothetical protein
MLRQPVRATAASHCGSIIERSRAARLCARADVSALLGNLQPAPLSAPVIDVCFEFAGAALSFFSVVSTIGTPIDVTAQELRLEAFFPSDEKTRLAWPATGSSTGVP